MKGLQIVGWMNAQDKFKELLKALLPFLKGYGYSRRRQIFRTRLGNNWGMISFQKSRYNTNSQVEFTINLEVCLQALSDIYPGWKKDTPPEHGYGHWRRRIGFLLPGRLDKWWVIDASTELPDLVEELEAVLALGVAEIKKYLKDEDFRDYLLAGGATGFTRYHSLMCLFVLANKYGPREKLPAILEKLKGSAITDFLKQNVEEQIRLIANTDE